MRAAHDPVIATLTLLAAALVLAAPVVGRAGHAEAANLLMLAAASSGLGAFALAGLATVRAARARQPHAQEKEIR